MGEKRMKIKARFHNLDVITNIEEVKSDKIGNFISIKGVVLKTMPVRLLTIRMIFKCFECKQDITVRFKNGEYVPPKRCGITPRCQSRSFIPNKYLAETVLY